MTNDGTDRGSRWHPEGLKSLWAAARKNWRRLAVMAVVWIVIGMAAWIVARLTWRDDVARSLIGGVALVLFAATTLAIFGVQGPQTLVAVVAALGAVVAVAGGTIKVNTLLPAGPPNEGALVDCPPEPPPDVPHGFVANTDLGYSLLRTEPKFSAHVLLKYPPGCELRFTSYCIGQPKISWRFHDPDSVWFYAPGDFHDGYIPAADIRAGPAGIHLQRKKCPGGEPAPHRPQITAPLRRRLEGSIEITAAAPNADEVGFAAYYENRPGKRRSATWHQIGVDLNTEDGISAAWDTRSIPGQGLQEPAPLTIAAVPCLALDFAFRTHRHTSAGMRSYVAANRGGPQPAPLLPQPSKTEPGLTACNNAGR
jgi:hypothetical protein